MTLTAGERAHIVNLWAKVAPHANDLGAEAFERMLTSFPQTKTYFSHIDLSHGSADLKTQGGKVLNALGKAATHLDDIYGILSSLSDLHAHKLRVDPGNFCLLSHTILVVFAIHFPCEFSPAAHAAWDKFISEVSKCLTAKYR